jgi:hypothetical protein
MYQEPGQHDDAAAEAETSVMAVGSVVAGILGLSLLPTIGSVIALGLGYAARSDVRSKEAVKGERFATVGIVLGWIGVGVAIVGVCLALWAILLGLAAVPGFTLCGGLGGGF